MKKLKIGKFYVSSFTFQDVIYKNNSDLICHIYIINTNTDSKTNWPLISLLFPGNNLENIWNIVWQEKCELGTHRNRNLIHFEIFITNICMKVPGIWHTKKLEKNWNLGPKTLRKPGIWYLVKSGNPANTHTTTQLWTSLMLNMRFKHIILHGTRGRGSSREMNLLMNGSVHRGHIPAIWWIIFMWQIHSHTCLFIFCSLQW